MTTAPTAATSTSTITAAPYSFADELPIPAQIGVRRDGSVDGIMAAVAGVNYYTDAIGFGTATGINTQSGMKPLGLRSFLATGLTCSNGQPAYEYWDSTPQGDLLGARVQQALTASGLPGLRGLGPGIAEDARDALNPLPLFQAAAGTGVPVCTLATLPVGDLNNNLRSPNDPTVVWVPDADVQWSGGQWLLSRWVQATDAAGNLQWAAGVSTTTEGFQAARLEPPGLRDGPLVVAAAVAALVVVALAAAAAPLGLLAVALVAALALPLVAARRASATPPRRAPAPARRPTSPAPRAPP
jgi:hypothetical protein